MIVAPAKTPCPVVDRLQREMAGFLSTREVKDQIAKVGFVPIASSSTESLQSFVNAEIERWGKVVRDAGFARSMTISCDLRRSASDSHDRRDSPEAGDRR